MPSPLPTNRFKKSFSATFFLGSLLLLIFVLILNAVWWFGISDRVVGETDQSTTSSLTTDTVTRSTPINAEQLDDSIFKKKGMTVESKADIVDQNGSILHTIQFKSTENIDIVTEYYVQSLEKNNWKYSVIPLTDEVRAITGMYGDSERVSINVGKLDTGSIVGVTYNVIGEKSENAS